MKRFACTVVLFSAAALCGVAANAQTSAADAASPSSAKTSAFAATVWSPAVKTILAESKAAMGGATWDHIHSLRTKGMIKVGGLTGPWTRLENLQTGSWVFHVSPGPVKVAGGFDGQTLWHKAPNGQASAIDAKKAAVTNAYTTERAWWYPERSPAKIRLLGKKQAGGKTFDVLKITPKGGIPFQLWINATTHLVARTGKPGASMTYLSNYRTVDEVKIPFQRLTIKGKQRRRITRQIKTVSVNVPVSAADFAMPTQHKKSVTVIGGDNTVTIPFKSVFNLIYIPVKVNGHPFNFVVDTGSGAANLLTPQAARAIDIDGQGAQKVGGYGSKTVKAQVAKGKSLVLDGKVSFRNPLFIIVPLPTEVLTRQSLAGTVGHNLFEHFVVRMDYAHKKLTLIQPANFDPSTAGTRIPISVFAGIPAVKGSIDGLSGLFLIDTGTVGTVALTSPFASKHDLYARYRTTPAFTPPGGGVRGKVSVRAARGGKLKIGGVAVHNPVIFLSTATNKGVLSRKGFAGIVGGEVLKRFTVTFDYADNAMYLKPNQTYGKPMHFNRTGVFAKLGKNGFVVVSVIKGSTGAQAGIKAGDVITAVNGTPASKISLQALSKMARNDPPGTKQKLTIGQGKAAHTVTLTLRRLIPKTGGLAPKSSLRGS